MLVRLHFPALMPALMLAAACAPTVAPQPLPPPPPGMELLMGKPADAAVAVLGQPGLDRREGPARHMQFAAGCILDLFYYPKAGETPLASFAEARARDGKDMPAGDCLQQQLRAREAAASAAPPPPAKKPPRRRR